MNNEKLMNSLIESLRFVKDHPEWFPNLDAMSNEEIIYKLSVFAVGRIDEIPESIGFADSLRVAARLASSYR